MVRIFLSAGEPSGVAIGATLMRTLKARLPDVSFAGLGGPAMQAEGLRVIYDPTQTATMWLWGNLKRIPAHRKALRACREDWKREPPDLVITIDYQAFHLYVGTYARAQGLKVLHFVGSQFWGRRYYTLKPIARAYDHVLLIHEFEKPYYDRAGIPATFVGHPLFERLRERKLDRDLVQRLESRPAPRLAILPGSRHAEILHSLPTMLAAAARLETKPHLIVSAAREASRPFIEKELAQSGLPGEVVDLASGEILSVADLALITSGSATMEAVYYGCPAVVMYRIHPLSYFFAKPQITGFIAQPNLIAQREIVPELLLGSNNPEPVAIAAQHLLKSRPARDAQLREFKALRQRLLKGPVPSQKAADVAQSMLGSG